MLTLAINNLVVWIENEEIDQSILLWGVGLNIYEECTSHVGRCRWRVLMNRDLFSSIKLDSEHIFWDKILHVGIPFFKNLFLCGVIFIIFNLLIVGYFIYLLGSNITFLFFTLTTLATCHNYMISDGHERQ